MARFPASGDRGRVLAERCVLESTVRPAWVWAGITDASNIAAWSGFDRCLGDGPPVLEVGSERTCSMSIGEHSLHATLTVLEAREQACLRLRTEAAMATVFETIHLEPTGRGTTVFYELDVHSPLLARSLKAWIAQHVGIVHHGLEDFLDADGACSTHADYGRTG